jgi:5'-methylthioadenosine phosphorylase
VPTPFGTLSAAVTQDGLVVVRRHGPTHGTPPHRLNFRAVADGLRRLGVRHCFATAAVGSLRTDWPPGTLAAVRDYVDLSGRRLTLFDRTVRHTAVDVQGPTLALLEQGNQLPGAVYANLDGPRYETPAEIAMLARLGVDVVGMTAGTEAMLLAEAGVGYACLAVVSNFASGISGSVLDHKDVVTQVEAQAAAIEAVLSATVAAARGQG